VETAGSWSALLAEPGGRAGLAAVLLGEYGSVAEEEEILRRFRDEGGPGIPVLLIGGRSAVRRTRRFREAGADMVFAADLPEEEILDRAQPLLAYGEMFRKAALAGRELSDFAMRDGLTGLPDRRRFTLDLARCAEMARRIGRPLSCIVTDIDDLRRVNETYGPGVGDSVIRQFGGVLSRVKRSYDTVARLGGDQFVWLLLGVGRDEALRAAERAQRQVSGSVFNGTLPRGGVERAGPRGKRRSRPVLGEGERKEQGTVLSSGEGGRRCVGRSWSTRIRSSLGRRSPWPR